MQLPILCLQVSSPVNHTSSDAYFSVYVVAVRRCGSSLAPGSQSAGVRRRQANNISTMQCGASVLNQVTGRSTDIPSHHAQI